MSDTTKPKLSLLPWRGAVAVVRAMDAGNRQGNRVPGDWDQLPDRSVLLDSALRHLAEVVMDPEALDESGEPHAAHAAASLLIYLDLGASEQECWRTDPQEEEKKVGAWWTVLGFRAGSGLLVSIPVGPTTDEKRWVLRWDCGRCNRRVKATLSPSCSYCGGRFKDRDRGACVTTKRAPDDEAIL